MMRALYCRSRQFALGVYSAIVVGRDRGWFVGWQTTVLAAAFLAIWLLAPFFFIELAYLPD
ncbi:MAG: hypothetical protein H6729_03660 [Deltaproteobacteria bacterium]|nr:hypothetical protein [Deltaproteobacteria bacterium]